MAVSKLASQLHAIQNFGSSVEGPWTLQDFTAELASEVAQLFVWPSTSELRGFVCSRQALDEVWILNLAVKNKGRGEGRKMMESWLSTLRSNPALKQVGLEVSANNQAARTLYLAMGFKEVSLRQAYYRDGSDGGIWVLTL